MKNEELIQIVKGIIDTNSGGLMNEQQLKGFIETVIKKSNFLSEIRVESGIGKSLKLDRLGIASRSLRKGVEGVAGEDVSLSIGNRVLTPTEVILPVAVTYSYLRKALGGTPNLNPDGKTAVEGVINNAIANQFSNDMVDIAWNGNLLSTDNFLKILDGLIVKMTADSAVNKSTFGASDLMVDIMDGMISDLPSEYQNRVNELKFYMSPANERLYRKQLADKNTALGDLMMVKNDKAYFQGIELSPCFAIPDTALTLTMSQNLVVGIGQEILVERQKEITKRVIHIVTTADIDVNYVISEAVVLYTKSV